MEKTKKEGLTREAIKKDLLRGEKGKLWHSVDRRGSYIMPFILLAVINGILTKSILIGILICPIPIYHFIKLIYEIHISNTRKHMITNDEFTITKDTLQSIGKELIYEPHMRGKRVHTTKEVSFFYFSSQKWRVINTNKHYAWSELYHMSTAGLFNTSLCGDEFYLVLHNLDNEIEYVYNTKLFEWKESEYSEKNDS